MILGEPGMKDVKELREYYSGRVKELSGGISGLKRAGRILVASELVAFAAAIGFVAAYTVHGSYFWLVGTAAMLIGYVAFRRVDVSNAERVERLTALRSVYEGELDYLDGRFDRFDAGERYVDPCHEFTFDMDIFGRSSLYQRINRTVTQGGADILARCLEMKAFGPESGKALIDRRADAVERLAEMEGLRAGFMAMRRYGPIDTRAVKTALGTAGSLPLPSFASSTVARAVAVALIVVFALLIALAVFTDMPSGVPVMWGTLMFFGVLMLCSGPLRQMSKAVNSLCRQMKAYTELVRLAATTELCTVDDPCLGMSSGGEAAAYALTSFDELRRILDGLDRRGNVLGLIVFDTFLLSDFFLVRRFCRWQGMHAADMERWIDSVSVLDALVSMATFRYNEPSAGRAEIADTDGVVYDARGIYHPFLGASAVPNDLRIEDNHYYIVTGANMAGKSTFLRSLGVNYLLAVNGMPVFAAGLRVSLFSLFSSMRTSDNLSRGISYFNAELLRLGQLMEACRRSPRTLIILDEILKGTNSLDKLNGSRMFLDAISELPVTGIIATHDLELSKMADSPSGRFHNLCFEIELSDNVTYTYKITPGVARNQNATWLLRNMIRNS